MRNLNGIIFIWIRIYRKIFKSALMYFLIILPFSYWKWKYASNLPGFSQMTWYTEQKNIMFGCLTHLHSKSIDWFLYECNTGTSRVNAMDSSAKVQWSFSLVDLTEAYSEPSHTTQKMKFSIKDFFSKCDQIRRKLRIWSHLLKRFLIENLIFCAVSNIWDWAFYEHKWRF